MRLTVGMAVYDDYDGVYFTVQALRAYHDLTDCEIVIVDNYGDDRLEGWANHWGRGLIRYDRFSEIVGTTQSRQRVFDIAKGEVVICIDSHVLLLPGSLDGPFPDGDDLWHGPMCYDDFTYVTHMEDTWNAHMWGVWCPARSDLPEEPFEIPMHGLGLFASRRESWLGFNEDFRGFGGEEGYIHRKYQLAGRKVLCLPKLRWVHKFNYKVNYPLDMGDRVRNYLLGFRELGMDPEPIYKHFGSQMVTKIASTISR
jgi:glycosyltransferase involved in cell wall biosynthesis